MKEGKLKKIIKIDWTIFYSKPRIQILGILIFLDIMLLFSVTKEMEKGFSVSSVSTSIVLFILFSSFWQNSFHFDMWTWNYMN